MNRSEPSVHTTTSIGAIVEYGMDSFGMNPATYRVTGWLLEMPEPADLDCGTPGNRTPEQFMNSIIMELRRENPPAPGRKRYRWCLEDEASHLALSGIAGAVGPVDQCKFVRMVDWPENQIAEDRQYAIELGEKGEVCL